MGSSGSKAARKAAGGATRKYPSRPPASRPPPPPPSRPAQDSLSSQTKATAQRNEVVDLDGRDPQFASRLAELGPVKPAPTYSPSATTSQGTPSPSSPEVSRMPQALANSPAITIVNARKRVQDEVEQEKIDAGSKDFAGRRYVDVTTIRKVLAYRDEQGMKDEDIERALGLRKGVVSGLGQVGIVEVA